MGHPEKSTGAGKPERPGGRGLAGRKIIRCPHCRDILMDIDKNDKVELFSLPARAPRNTVRYQEVKQCHSCRRKTGYNLISPAAP